MISIPTLGQSSTNHLSATLAALRRRLAEKQFIPQPGLTNGHAQTILGNSRVRNFKGLLPTIERREFQTEPNVRVVAFCSWQREPRQHPTVLVIHGLEGSSEASYVIGTAAKAFALGFNVIRYNVRNCGGTEHLTPTLYHSGLTIDLHLVIRELLEKDGLPELFVVGFSMGGNQTLKMAGELGADFPAELRGVCAISPPINLAHCSRAIGEKRNVIYEYRFLRSLRRRMRRKQQLFPELYQFENLDRVRSLWEFDEVMAPAYGFADAADYYARASAGPYIKLIKVPTLIIHAADDPFIPMTGFADAGLEENENVIFINPRHGGHVAFCGRKSLEDRAWAENRAVEFCQHLRGSNP